MIKDIQKLVVLLISTARYSKTELDTNDNLAQEFVAKFKKLIDRETK